jgi:hypothetical protein
MVEQQGRQLKPQQSSGSTEKGNESYSAAPRALAKSADPSYTKFTTYIRKTTHLEVKTRLVSKRMELSDLVESLLLRWLKENDAHG